MAGPKDIVLHAGVMVDRGITAEELRASEAQVLHPPTKAEARRAAVTLYSDPQKRAFFLEIERTKGKYSSDEVALVNGWIREVLDPSWDTFSVFVACRDLAVGELRNAQGDLRASAAPPT